LLAAIDAKHAREFARKPQDLIELCDDWREHGGFVRTSSRSSPMCEPGSLPARAAGEGGASPAKALTGAQRLALAVILSRRLTIRYSAGSDADASGRCAD